MPYQPDQQAETAGGPTISVAETATMVPPRFCAAPDIRIGSLAIWPRWMSVPPVMAMMAKPISRLPSNAAYIQADLALYLGLGASFILLIAIPVVGLAMRIREQR